MAVINRNGEKIDLAAARERLSSDRDSGRISNRDYKRANKGLNRIADANRKGINYQFTEEGRFKTTSSSGHDISLNDAGVGVNTQIPLFGKKVSKAMGYIQANNLVVPDKKGDSSSKSDIKNSSETKSGDAKSGAPVTTTVTPSISGTNPSSSESNPSGNGFNSKFSTGYQFGDNVGSKFSDPNYKFDSTLDYRSKGYVPPSIGSTKTPAKEHGDYIDYDSVPKFIGEPAIPLWAMPGGAFTNSRVAQNVLSVPQKVLNAPKAVAQYASKSMDGLRKVIDNIKTISIKGQQALPNYAPKQLPYPKWLNEGTRQLPSPKWLNAPQKALPQPMKFASGAKIIIDPVTGLKKRVLGNSLGDITKNIGISNGTSPIVSGGNRRTLSTDTKTPSAYNINGSNIPGKDSLINTALGAYGAVSLLTAKRPRIEKPKQMNLSIRPAQGDEGMVSRSMNSIDESVRKGSGELRRRTGSDLSSYVQGITAMTDNAGRARAEVLGNNAQMKRADENRMFGEVNQEKSINLELGEQHRRENMIRGEQMYSGRVQGAQAAVNNSLNYGVQKRATERNNEVQLDMANKRLEFMLLNQAQNWRSQGMTEEEIAKRIDEYRKTASFKKGGRISDSVKMKIASSKDIAKANSDMRKLFREYSKLISDASMESIKQFNQNIRAINQRNNITITSR